MWKTFEEWNDLGYRIHKGEKATNGKFSDKQVYLDYDPANDEPMDDDDQFFGKLA